MSVNDSNSIIRGCWQLARDHSHTDAELAPLVDALQQGFSTFDCADIYLGVEEQLGQLAREFADKSFKVHTKFVPDKQQLATLDRRYVQRIIERSLKRLNVECLELVQFHWWDWAIKGYFTAMDELQTLKQQGKIKRLGLTNVNLMRLKAFSRRFDIDTLQTQVSLFDRRAERGIRDYCYNNSIEVLGYGALLGGFLSEPWLQQPEPSLAALTNRSLVKYKLLIDSACGWSEFNRRLQQLIEMAHQYRCSIASIVIAALLQLKRLDKIIVGLSPRNYKPQNRSLMVMPRLEQRDLQRITAWHCNITGDAYDIERDTSGAHAKVMKMNGNLEA